LTGPQAVGKGWTKIKLARLARSVGIDLPSSADRAGALLELPADGA
jgi:hypothetical protein